MKLNRIKNTNATVLELNNGNEVLMSYSTPVAAYIDHTFYKTDQFFSVTTSRHISKYLGGAKAEVKPQSFFDNLLN